MKTQIGKYSSFDAAVVAAKQSKKEGVIIKCDKSNLYYVEEGDGGIIRYFEEIVLNFRTTKIETA